MGSYHKGHLFVYVSFFFLMIRRPPRFTEGRSSAASDVYKRQDERIKILEKQITPEDLTGDAKRYARYRTVEIYRG